ncbi:MAG: shikimate kinase [Thaumarchaeota archaeon]|nr:shikimate kinase [Nitrososphaerota archaeon]
MKGKGTVFGAITVVNAIAGGKGVTASVKLETEATVEVYDKPGEWVVFINGKKQSEPRLALQTVEVVMRSAGKDPKQFGGEIRTESVVPLGVGLKTSSASSCATALALFAAIGQKAFDPRKIMNCSVEASLASGASITGAMDDAASCLMGGLNLVDNLGRKVERSQLFKKTLKVLIKVPETQSRRSMTKMEEVKMFGKVMEVPYRMSMEGDPWRAMTINGALYSGLLGYDPLAALQAIEHGALGASLSGTGPATAAVFEPNMEKEFRSLAEAWASDGSKVIETETNNEHGRILSLD